MKKTFVRLLVIIPVIAIQALWLVLLIRWLSPYSAVINFILSIFAAFFVLYIIWLIALWFHLTHGFWSSMQTLGWNNTTWINRWKCISNIYSTIIVLGFMLVAVVFFLKNMMGCGAC